MWLCKRWDDSVPATAGLSDAPREAHLDKLDARRLRAAAFEEGRRKATDVLFGSATSVERINCIMFVATGILRGLYVYMYMYVVPTPGSRTDDADERRREMIGALLLALP